MRSNFRALVVCLAVLFLSACGAEPQPSDMAGAGPGLSALAETDAELVMGNSGEAVRALHRYLLEYGYFPNAELQRRYPAWRSPVEAGPSSEDVFDERTVDALLAFQQNMGIAETGMVDAATREVLLQARCGNPEMAQLDASDKWDHYAGGLFYDRRELTWRMLNPGGCGLSQAQAEAAITAGLNQWTGPTQLTFVKTTGVPNIEVRCSTADPLNHLWAAGTLAASWGPDNGSGVWMNSGISWSAASPTPAGKYDFQSVVTHELGHAIGLAHSSVTSLAVMYPTSNTATQHRALQPDDRVGAMAMDVSWYRFDNASIDIDVDSGPTFNHINVTGDPVLPGGYAVWRMEFGSWTQLGSIGAVRVGSDGGVLWAVQDDGDIYSWDGSSWIQRPGCAYDIALGNDGSVWIVSCDIQFTDGSPIRGYKVKKWNGASFVTAVGGQGAWRISVGPAAPGGVNVPWIVDQAGGVWRRTSNLTASGSWASLPGTGTDIAVNPTGNAWLIGTATSPGGYKIYAWNEQPALAAGIPNPVARFRWKQVAGAAVNVSVDHEGSPYLVNNAKRAYWAQ